MQCYSDLTKTSFANNSSYFVSHFDVQNFFETFEVFEIKNVIKLFVWTHLKIDCLKFADIVGTTILFQNSKILFETTWYGNFLNCVLSSFFDLLLLEFNFFFNFINLFFGLLLLLLILFLPMLHWIIDCSVYLILVVGQCINCLLIIIPANIIATFQPPLQNWLYLTTLFPCAWIVHVGHFDCLQDSAVLEYDFVLPFWFDAFATATSQFVSH